MNSIPKHDFLLECGDFNAHLGAEDAPHTFHEETNTNGSLLLEHAEECALRITNTTFEKKKGKLWTYLSDMNCKKSQVDYILVNKKWKNSIHNVEAYNFFSSSGSDHRLVAAKIKLSLRRMRKTPKKKRYDWTVLRDGDTQQMYSVTLRNRYQDLVEDSDDISEKYQKLMQANTETADKLVPVLKSNKTADIADDKKVEKARKKVQTAFDSYSKRPTRSLQKQLQNSKDKLKQVYDKVQERELNSMIKEVENASYRNKHRESWKLIKRITGKNASKGGMIKGTTKEERIKKWHNHFKNLLGKEGEEGEHEYNIDTVFEDLGINDSNFTNEELEAAKLKIKEGKQAGSDNFPPEVAKNCDLNDITLSFANALIEKNIKPNQWAELDLIPIPKPGDLTTPENYRGITLMSIMAKLVNKMILNRIQEKLDPHLRPNQNGFRPKRSTTSHILALRRLIEGVKSHNRKAIILYVDFRKAFDSINRGEMFKILKAYAVPPRLLNAIITMYESTKARVRSPDGETDYFEIFIGVLQGDTLAPYLFAIVLDYVMRQVFEGRELELGFHLHRRRSRRNPAVVITDLDFADDLALLTEEIVQAQEILTRLETEAIKVGLQCNGKKTELQAFNHDTPVKIKTLDGTEIKSVKNFKYLGAWTESTIKDFAVRKALAWSACHNLSKIWKSQLPRQLKIRLFLSTVESVYLYGCGTWTLTKSLTNKIDGAYTKMLRMALNVSWKSHTSNESLYGNLPKVSQKVRERRMRLAGHCVRHPEEPASQLVLWQPTEGKRSRGKPATTYIDNLLADSGLDDIEHLDTAMRHREYWRRLVNEEMGRPRGRP